MSLLEVIDINSEGLGVAKNKLEKGPVVFIPFTVPGDILEAEIVEKKKNYQLGKLLKLIKPSEERMDPTCPYFGKCGGCQLQHMNYDYQLVVKKKMITETLSRIGKLTDFNVQDVEKADPIYAYRRHVTLKIKEEKGFVKLGYIAIDNETLLNITKCPIFIADDDPLLKLLSNWLNSISFPALTGILTCFKTDDQKLLLHLTLENSVEDELLEINTLFKSIPEILGIAIDCPKKRKVFGTYETVIHLDDLKLKCSPDVFIQNHTGQSLKIYKELVKNAAKLPQSTILDLYCGIGASSFFLAKDNHSVVSIEVNPESIRFAKQNAFELGLSNVQFYQGDVKKVLSKELKNIRPDIVIINPPRIGASPEVIDQIIHINPQMILYVSCKPSTLARDLQVLVGANYKIESIQPFDMFPQTAHVETLVVLTK